MSTAVQDAPAPTKEAKDNAKSLADMSVEELTAHAARSFNQSTATGDQAVTLGRKSVSAYLAAGEALTLIKERLTKTKEWVIWQDDHAKQFGTRPTISECISFYAAAKVKPDLMDQFTSVAEAKKVLGVGNHKPSKQREAKPLTFRRAASKLINAVEAIADVENAWKIVTKDAKPEDLRELREYRDQLAAKLDTLDDLLKDTRVVPTK